MQDYLHKVLLYLQCVLRDKEGTDSLNFSVINGCCWNFTLIITIQLEICSLIH